MGYDKKQLLEHYNKWKKQYMAKGGREPCLHQMYEEEQHIDNNDILHFLQHLNKVDAGQISQERQHEQNNIMVTA